MGGASPSALDGISDNARLRALLDPQMTRQITPPESFVCQSSVTAISAAFFTAFFTCFKSLRRFLAANDRCWFPPVARVAGSEPALPTHSASPTDDCAACHRAAPPTSPLPGTSRRVDIVPPILPTTHHVLSQSLKFVLVLPANIDSPPTFARLRSLPFTLYLRK